MPTVTTTDGIEIFYKDWGSGQPVVFSHGWPLTADVWDGSTNFVASRGFRAVAHDRRGGGRSSQPWDGNDLDHYADDLAAVIEALDLTDIVLVGHSYGGCVISGVAEAAPGAIRSLVFPDAFIPDDGDATLDLVQPAVQDVIRAALAHGLHVMCEKPLTLDTVEARALLASARAAGATHGVNFRGAGWALRRGCGRTDASTGDQCGGRLRQCTEGGGWTIS